MEGKEFNIKKEAFSVYWDSENQILFHEFWGGQDIKSASEYKEINIMFFEKFSAKSLKIFVDALKVTEIDTEARRIFSEAVKIHPVSAQVAVCYKNILFKIIAGFITAVSLGKLKVKFFEDKEKALKWLKSQK